METRDDDDGPRMPWFPGAGLLGLALTGAGVRLALLAGVGALLVLAAVLVAVMVIARSMLAWPIETPRRVQDGPYRAAGWSIAVPYGWVADPDDPGAYRFHEGVTLVGEGLCAGCPAAPIADLEVRPHGVRWEDDANERGPPGRRGSGVVVEAEVQHPGAESGSMNGQPLIVRYGHLHPYYVYVRTQMCQRDVTCPTYEPTDAGVVQVTCAGDLIPLPAPFGEQVYAYGTPGTCRAQVTWPEDWIADGPTEVRFDQQIVPGSAAADAAISFRAQAPPPTPTPTPPPSLLPTPSPSGAQP